MPYPGEFAWVASPSWERAQSGHWVSKQWLAEAGEVSSQAMFETFNMGIGLVVLVPSEQLEPTLSGFNVRAIAAYCIGEVVEGSGQVVGLPE